MAKQQIEKLAVKMNDGRTVLFGKKQKLDKDVLFKDGKAIGARFDLVNGQGFEFFLANASPQIQAMLMAHGAKQKIGDECADLDSPEDMAEAIEDMIQRLTESGGNRWDAERTGFSGQSLLVTACMEAFGKTKDEVRAILATMNAKEKAALKLADKVKPIIDRLEAERAKGGDSDAAAGKFA